MWNNDFLQARAALRPHWAKLDISSRKVTGRIVNVQSFSSVLLNNARVKEEISRANLEYFELNEIKNTTYQNLWDVAKVVLRGKFITLNVGIRK